MKTLAHIIKNVMMEKSLYPKGLRTEDHLDDFNSVNAVWNKLLDEMPHRQVFFTPLWGKTWWRHLGSGELHLLTVHHSEQIIGFAPLKLRGRTATLLGDKEVCDYLDVMIAPGEEQWMLEALRSYGREKHIRLDLYPMHPESPIVGLISAGMKADPKLCREHLDFSYVLEAPSTWEEYQLLLPRKQRHELRRKINRLEESGKVSFYSVEPSRNNMDDFFRLFRKRSDKAAFLTSDREYFFRDIAIELGNKEWLRLYFLELEKERVATTLCFHYGETLSLYNSGFDPAFASLSVGLVAKAWTIMEAIKMGVKKFDFLRGAEEYKEHLGGTSIRVYRCTMDP